MNKTSKTAKNTSKNNNNKGSKVSKLIDSRTKDGLTLSSKSYCDFLCSLSYDELRRI